MADDPRPLIRALVTRYEPALRGLRSVCAALTGLDGRARAIWLAIGGTAPRDLASGVVQPLDAAATAVLVECPELADRLEDRGHVLTAERVRERASTEVSIVVVLHDETVAIVHPERWQGAGPWTAVFDARWN